MRRRIRSSALVWLVLVVSPAVGVAQAAPLFADDGVVSLTIRGPLAQVFTHRDQEKTKYPGTLIASHGGSKTDTIAVELRTRGHSRLSPKICAFPPLRLDMAKRAAEGTLLEGQRRLKLVTHCGDNAAYEQYLLREYLAYRIYNLLTELSFRVRLARITYEESDGSRDDLTRFGFLIESEAGAAERAGWSYIAAPVVPPDAVDPESLALLEIFEYMIGNTDWSAFLPDEGSDECCHNVKPIGAQAGPVFPIAYDFDVTGFVYPRYADRLYQGTLERLGLRSVKDRRFRGLCRSAPYWPALLDTLEAKKGDIEDLIQRQEGMTTDSRRYAQGYIDAFYRTARNRNRALQEFEGSCRQG